MSASGELGRSGVANMNLPLRAAQVLIEYSSSGAALPACSILSQ
jgi:hypothetical protein